MNDFEIRNIEELSLNAHPAHQTESYDGWLLKTAGGYTNRANSVNMLYPSTLPIEKKVDWCENYYHSIGQASVFKVTPLSEAIDSLLADRGYEYVTKTNLMELPLTDDTFSKTVFSDLKAEIFDGLSNEIEDAYFSFISIDEHGKEMARQIHRNILMSQFWACIRKNNRIVAVGMCVIERGYVGLYNIVVSKEYRRNGYGTDICASLIKQAKSAGAVKGYLQVVDANANAKVMYEKLGYTYCYSYWYRVKKD